MKEKPENFQLPAGEKSNRSDEEFAEDLEIANADFEALHALKKEYADKKQCLERIIKEQDDPKTKKNLEYIKRTTGKNPIKGLEKELLLLEGEIKYTSKKIGKIVGDPRYSEKWFKENYENNNINHFPKDA